MFPCSQQMLGKIKHRREMPLFSDKFLKFFFLHVKYFTYGERIIFLEGMHL